MAEKVYNQHLEQKGAPRKGRGNKKQRQPFSVPALSFYAVAGLLTTIVFFFFWAAFYNEEGGAWILAAILAGLVLTGAVALREIVFRNRRQNLLLAQEKLDFNLQNVYRQQRQNSSDENKLTLEKNAIILKEIAQKSEAAKVLGKFSDAHREVFELCGEYLHRNEKELETIRTGSPRLAALTNGRDKVRLLHKFHLLAWSASESRSLLQEARATQPAEQKLESAAKALNILESALEFYPDDPQLIESESVVREFLTSVKISNWIEKAEKAAFKGKNKRAIDHYEEALFYLSKEAAQSPNQELMAQEIQAKIAKLQNISNQKEKKSIKGQL